MCCGALKTYDEVAAGRACHAALSIQKALEVFGEKIKNDFGADFKMRIGLNSGPVVVGSIGDDLRMDYTAVGDTTNLASRIENMARPGTSLVSGHTHKLARDFFEFKSLGKVEVKGKEEPQRAYELLKAGRVETRIGAAAAKGLTRFVGRKNSLALLKEALEEAEGGAGQVVSILGEAGVGKSRLLLEFKNLLQSEYAYLEGQCFHFGGSMSYLPFLDILRSYFEIKEGDREVIINQKMTDKITKLDGKLENGAIQREDNKYVLTGTSSDIQVPETIQGIIAARMDRLEDNLKRTMQLASVIGRDFAFRILQTITGLREELKGYLINLQGLEFIYEKSLFPELEYIFKHALTREVAYNSLLQKSRKEIHEKIGNAIEQIYTERLEEFFEMLAYHFEQGEIWEKALEYTLEAAERARNLYAQPEAISHYWKALELLSHLPRTVERGRTHIEVVLSLMKLRGLLMRDAATLKVILRHIDEAMRTADDFGDAARLALLESGKGMISMDENLFTRAIIRAETSGHALARAHTANLYGLYLGMIGQYEKALPYIGQAIEILGTEGERYEQAHTMAVGGRCYYARAGKLEEALSYAARAREIGEAMDNAMLRAWGAMEAEPYIYKGLWEQVIRVAEEGLPVAWEIGEWLVIFASSTMLGIAYLKLGRLEDAKRVLDRALKESEARPFPPYMITYMQITVAHLHLSLGEPDVALGVARNAIELAENNRFLLEQGAANRVLGQVYEAMGNREKADAAFRRSLQVLEGIQSRPELAQTILAYGRFKAGGDDSAGGRTLIESALRLFEEMGATGWIDEARAAF